MIAFLRSPAAITALLASMAASAVPGSAQPLCRGAGGAEQRAWLAPLDRPVSLRARDLPLRDALDRLSAAARVPVSYASDLLPLDRRVCVDISNEPVGGALVALLAGFRIVPRVVAGQVVLAPAGGSAAEAEAAPTIVDRVNVLEGIVVTGSPLGNPRRSLTIAMDAVNGRELERRDARSISQLLNAAAPGIWAWPSSPSNMLAQYGSVRGASSFGATYPKVYVDGVEAANPLLVNEIDPAAVERVEVIRGPQGAALYGSDAISGVVNIVTRHSAPAGPRPGVEVRSRVGASASDYSSSPLPTHEQRVSIRVGTNVRSAGAAINLGGTGAVFPGADARQIGAVADARWVGGKAIATGTLRLSDRRAGSGQNPLVGAFVALPDSLSSGESRQALQRYTVGSSIKVAPDDRWQHTLLLGADGYRLDHDGDAASAVPFATDSALRAAGGSGDRGTLRAGSSLRIGRSGSGALGTLSFGFEHSVLRQSSRVGTAGDEPMRGGPPPGGESPAPTMEIATREEWSHNTGVLLQGEGASGNTLFGTAGLRLERNDAFTTGTYALLPMLGAAWVRRIASAEVKLRAAYGRGIRPARTPARAHMRFDRHGEFRTALDPERQGGVEVGAELHAGRTFSVQVTRFDQKATGLIQDVAIGVETIPRGDRRGAPVRRVRYEMQNVGAISNRGWEMQASLSRGALSLSGTLALVNSRVRNLADGYLGDLQPGDRVLAVPARTASLAGAWEAGPWTTSLTASRAWDWINYDRVALARDFAREARLPREMLGPALREYWRAYTGSTELRATLGRQVSSRLWLTAVGDNLLGRQTGEPDNVTIRPGRTITIGARAGF